MNRGRTILIAVLAASLALLAAAIVWQPSETPQGGRTGLSVIVVAVDGLDWYLVSRAIEEGRAPLFQQFAETAVLGEISADVPPRPEVGWTRFARGRSLSAEETATVTGLGDTRLAGLRPELLDVASSAGARTLSVGWPCSWPVADDEPLPTAAAAAPPAESHELSLAPAFYEGGPRQASSARIREVIDDAVAARERTLDEDFSNDIYDGSPPSESWADNLAAAKWSYLSDAATLDVAARLLAEEEPDLAFVYLGGLDAVTHRFLAPALPEYFEEPPSDAEIDAFSNVLGAYYRFIDGAVQRFHRLRKSNTLIVVCSVHGFHPGETAGPISGSHAQGPPGVLMVFSDKLKGKKVPRPVSTVDLAPTILAAIGVPIPNDLEGRVIPECIPSGRLAQAPPEYTEPPRRPRRDVEDPRMDDVDALAAARLAELRRGISD